MVAIILISSTLRMPDSGATEYTRSLYSIGVERSRFGVDLNAPVGYNLVLQTGGTDDSVLFVQGTSRVRYVLVVFGGGGIVDSIVWLSCQERMHGNIVSKWRIQFCMNRARIHEVTGGTLARWLTLEGVSLASAKWAKGHSKVFHLGLPIAAKTLLGKSLRFAKYSFEPGWLQGGWYRYSFIGYGGLESLENIYDGGPEITETQPYRKAPYPVSLEERNALADKANRASR